MASHARTSTLNTCLGLAVLALTAGTSVAGHTYFVGSANGGVWKLANIDPNTGFPDTSGGLNFSFGPPGARPIMGDWDGDGVDTIGCYVQATRTFYLRNSNSPGAPDEVLTLNGPGAALPVAGDWNGDGVDTVGLYDPALAVFTLTNDHGSTSSELKYNFGGIDGPAVMPVVGDWDGDGVDSVGLYNPATGTFLLRNSNAAGSGTLTLSSSGGGAPVAGDWDGDGVTTVGVYMPATGVFFLRNANTPQSPVTTLQVPGLTGGLPIAGESNPLPAGCDSADFNCDGDVGTDADIESFFACLGGLCPGACRNDADFNNDGDVGTDADIESFFRVLGGAPC